jgi:hypothetical protein
VPNDLSLEIKEQRVVVVESLGWVHPVAFRLKRSLGGLK